MALAFVLSSPARSPRDRERAESQPDRALPVLATVSVGATAVDLLDRGDDSSPGACGVRDAVSELERQLGVSLDDAVRTGTDLIAVEAFDELVRELAEGDAIFEHGVRWPLTCIDWDAAAEQLRVDHGYRSVTLEGRAYWSACWHS